MERALLNLRAVKSADPARNGLVFVFVIMAQWLPRACCEAIARTLRVCGRRAPAKRVVRGALPSWFEHPRLRLAGQVFARLTHLCRTKTQDPNEFVGLLSTGVPPTAPGNGSATTVPRRALRGWESASNRGWPVYFGPRTARNTGHGCPKINQGPTRCAVSFPECAIGRCTENGMTASQPEYCYRRAAGQPAGSTSSAHHGRGGFR